jgi:hypothetical protein
MSTKFEQLLDYLVNEEHEKANELFHEIVVEKSRTIYENLISEEEDEEMDEAKEEDMDESAEEEVDEAKEEDMDESAEEEVDEAKDEEMDESEEELEDSYVMDAEDEAEKHDFAAGDATDELGAEVMGGHDESDEEGHEGEEDKAIFDIKNAIEELEAAFAELEAAQGSEEADMGMDHDHEFGDEEDSEEDGEETDEMMGMHEGRRMTREYVEKVGHDWDKGSTQKKDGDSVGADTGEKMPAPKEGKSPVSSGKGKPTTGAGAGNIAQAGKGDNQDGQKPHGKAGGLSPEKSGQFTGKDWEANSKPGGKAGVKNLKNVNHDYAKKGTQKTPGPVGSGTGDKAGQTSVSSDKPFLKKL